MNERFQFPQKCLSQWTVHSHIQVYFNVRVMERLFLLLLLSLLSCINDVAHLTQLMTAVRPVEWIWQDNTGEIQIQFGWSINWINPCVWLSEARTLCDRVMRDIMGYSHYRRSHTIAYSQVRTVCRLQRGKTLTGYGPCDLQVSWWPHTSM